ncbi:hypothetical protein FS837_012833 [Tulasnella sp. UAMH 9824]|nr:hypothetical protein FS837_012833 [Tulasnella sp. UAMH 9824]
MREFTIIPSFNTQYTPEDALKTGLGIVSVIKEKIRLLDIGSKMRKDVWKKELEELSAHSTPTTLSATCGATGAGKGSRPCAQSRSKSSIINAVLDDTIVPTSGMRVCTAVVTEIAYKPGRTIEADVSFISREEWKIQLQTLLDDFQDEDRNVKASITSSEAGVAWSKIHAVYPQIPLDFLVTLTADQISAANSKEFGKAIAPFIESEEKKRGDDLEKPAHHQGSLPAKALQSGAVLVDLPGIGDANAARSSIAQGYTQRCHCIWILAPIARAVDDKPAKDLLGKAFRMQLMSKACIGWKVGRPGSSWPPAYQATDCNILSSATTRLPYTTFVATKADDLDCDEKLKQELRDKSAIVSEYKEWTRALKDGEDFEPMLTVKKVKVRQPENARSGKKRKNSNRSPKAKRRKSNRDEDEEDNSDLNLSISKDSDMSDVEYVISGLSESDRHSEDEQFAEDYSSVGENMSEDDEEIEGVTLQSLKAKQATTQEEARKIKEKLEATQSTSRKASKELSKLETRLAKVESQKNTFCANARNNFSRDVLKEDWRAGVREMDREAAMQNDPETFDSGFEARDYAAIDLPTFMVSSRDYIRLTKEVKDSGTERTCFSDTADTQIPALQEWRHSLTISSRERTARSFLQKLKTFSASVQSYLDDMNKWVVREVTWTRNHSYPLTAFSVSEVDRAQLRRRWASDYEDPRTIRAAGQTAYDSYDVGFNLDRLLGKRKAVKLETQTPSREPTPANPDGVAAVLTEKFRNLVDETVYSLHGIFRAGLEEKPRIGSAKASEMAYKMSVEFSRIKWPTCRAHLRRDGVFRRDLNYELCSPLTSSNAKRSLGAIERVIEEIEDSSTPGLRERCRVQGDLAEEDAQAALREMIQIVHEALQKEQKEISRSLLPHVQKRLRDVYIDRRGDMFAGVSKILLSELNAAAETVGNALDASLSELARKVEVLMSVLWENINTTAEQLVIRDAAVEVMAEISQQIQFWVRAEEACRKQGVLV